MNKSELKKRVWDAFCDNYCIGHEQCDGGCPLYDTLKYIDQLEEKLSAAACERDKLRELMCRAQSTMKAAAREIEDHWDAHCHDEEGYGPASLMASLETGIPGCFPGCCDFLLISERERDKLKATIDAVKAEIAWLKDTLMKPNPPGFNPSDIIEHIEWALNDPERTLRMYRMEGRV